MEKRIYIWIQLSIELEVSALPRLLIPLHHTRSVPEGFGAAAIEVGGGERVACVGIGGCDFARIGSELAAVAVEVVDKAGEGAIDFRRAIAQVIHKPEGFKPGERVLGLGTVGVIEVGAIAGNF